LVKKNPKEFKEEKEEIFKIVGKSSFWLLLGNENDLRALLTLLSLPLLSIHNETLSII